MTDSAELGEVKEPKKTYKLTNDEVNPNHFLKIILR
jgi:hypothetical protein